MQLARWCVAAIEFSPLARKLLHFYSGSSNKHCSLLELNRCEIPVVYESDVVAQLYNVKSHRNDKYCVAETILLLCLLRGLGPSSSFDFFLSLLNNVFALLERELVEY